VSGVATGATLGLLAGGGLALAVSRVPLLRRPTLDDRIAPYLRDTAQPSRLLRPPPTRTPFPTLERLLGPVVSEAARLLDRWLGGTASVRRRLDLLDAGTVERFRTEQLLWGGVALAGSLLLAVALAATGRSGSPVAVLMLCLLAALAAMLLRDRRLTREVAARERRMMAEFPTVAELLALSVAAGEGPVGALERVASLCHGDLATELRRALADARAGATLVQALERLAARTSLAPLRRFVDGVVVAVERGTPLADVLRAQALDAREAGRRALIETGARREIAMMVPVVFVVLPISVLFALFPGFYGLNLVSP